jgi:hypothetical protein
VGTASQMKNLHRKQGGTAAEQEPEQPSCIRFTIKSSALLGWKLSPPVADLPLSEEALGLTAQLPANVRQQGLAPMPMAIFRIHVGAVARATFRCPPIRNASMVDLIQFSGALTNKVVGGPR